MILADTSAWVEFDRTTGSSVDQRMAALISTDGPLAVTQPIVLEVWPALGTAPHEIWSACSTVPLVGSTDVDFRPLPASYRQCRSAASPRVIDCMLVAVAWRHADAILSCDVDLDRVCGVVGVPLDPASLRAP